MHHAHRFSGDRSHPVRPAPTGTALAWAALALAQPLTAQDAALRAFPQRPHSWDTPRSHPVSQLADGTRFVSDELLLTLLSDTDPTSIDAAIEAQGGRTIGAVPSTRLLRVQLCDGSASDAALARFGALPGVEHAELNGIGGVAGSPLPDDPEFPHQWHLDNTGQSGGKVGADIDALGAWGIGQGSAAVTMAILDSGIDFGHPEFVNRTLPGFDFVGEDPDPSYDHPHGFWVTGLAAANADNAFGVAGVDRQCSIVPVKVINQFGSGTTSDLVQGLAYCAQQGVDVVSMSLINYPGTQALQNAIAGARSAGCILVACAGNGGIGNADVSWPGASPLTMSIGASTKFDTRAGYSGTGTALDFIAPGDLVATASTLYLSEYATFSGCSAATPVAAGIVSLLVALDPTLTHDEAYLLLRFGAEDGVGPASQDTPGKDTFFGWGRLNAWRSLAGTVPCPAPTNYGTGKPTSLGTLPFLGTLGVARESFGGFAIHVFQGIPGAACVLMSGSGQASFPGLGGTIWLASPIVREEIGVLDAAGGIAFPIAIDAALVGTTGYYQVFLRDANHPDGTTAGLTDAIQVPFCP